jgi:hypothetical protein
MEYASPVVTGTFMALPMARGVPEMSYSILNMIFYSFLIDVSVPS